MIFLGIDPGETTGFMCMSVNKEHPEQTIPIDFGMIKYDDLDEWLDCIATVDTLVMESYRVFGHKAKAHIGSDLKTSQVIGKFKRWAHDNDVNVVEQPSSILSLAEKWTQKKMPKNHAQSHHVSAYLHVMFYLIKQKWALSALQKEKLNK